MSSLEKIKTEISQLDGFEQLITRKEIKELPQILWDDEHIHAIISGFYNKGNGLLLASTSRLIFVDKGILGGMKVEDFPLNQVSSIQYETGIMFGKVTIFTSSNKATIEQVEKQAAKRFAEVSRRLISKKESAETGESVKQQEIKSKKSSGNLSELERLAKLYEAGHLSDEEFAKSKSKLLD